ncbi:MAG TPA: serine/threonine-protein kinase [Isosphaeraceae bacterium]|jgi:serine/threonine-protein kinase|nr:serine/threonine-protein kinase [Isosphaeraceae bacterium]
MASHETSAAAGNGPSDLLPVIKRSGVLTERQFADVRAKVLRGDYPYDPQALAEQLVHDRVLTDYQARRFLSNKSHGLTVGRYVILDRIGSGSMGRVYKAHHLLMGRVVALKIIAPEIASNAKVVARFQREMRVVGKLDHPNVVRAFDADQIGNVLYIVMEYVSGKSLGHLLRSDGPLSPADVANFAAQAARGLAHAHEQGIVHRDIKPSNLLLNRDRQVKVLDLGLAALMEGDASVTFATADGIAVGTVDYMSPEQASGKDVDGRSDQYSLGCAMYHLLTGRVPFPGDSPIERLGLRISGRPVPVLEARADVPAPLVRVLDRLMAHRPADRFSTAADAADALQALFRKPAPPSPAIKPTHPTPTPRPAAPPPPQVVTVRPEYPAWFVPVASLAERSPAAILSVVLAAVLATFSLGFVLAWLLFRR